MLSLIKLAPGTFKRVASGSHVVVSSSGRIYYVAGKPGTLAAVASEADGGILVPNLPAPNGKITRNRLTCGVTISGPADAPNAPIWAQVYVDNNTDGFIVTNGGCDDNMDTRPWAMSVRDGTGNPIGKTTLGKYIFDGRQAPCGCTWQVGIPAHTVETFVFNLRELYSVNRPGRYTGCLTPIWPHSATSPPVLFVVR